MYVFIVCLLGCSKQAILPAATMLEKHTLHHFRDKIGCFPEICKMFINEYYGNIVCVLDNI